MERQDNRPIKEIFPNSRDIIKYSFTLPDGTDFFEFENFNDCPNERGFAALSYFNEMSMRCSREYLQSHCLAMDNIINSGKIDLMSIVKLHIQMKERLDWIFEPEIALKLCSVVFFTAEENPYRYDFNYGGKKAVRFKEAGPDFFTIICREPLVKLIPYISSFSNDLKGYLEDLTNLNQKHITNISMSLSETDRKLECFKQLLSQNRLDSAIAK